MSYPILKFGAKGARVRELQRKLGVEVDGEVGPVTWRVWKSAFVEGGGWGFSGTRARAKRRWRVVMDPGARTNAEKERAKKLAAARPLAAKAYEIAVREIGVAEVGGNNRGRRVDEIIRYAKGALGEPWCVDFVIWCYGHAGSKIVRPGFTRAVAYMLAGGVVQTSSPRLGDPVRYSFDHTGLFVGWRRLIAGRYVACPKPLATHIEAVEGNTGAAGAVSDSSSGKDGVKRKIRHRSLVSDFLRVPR